MNDIRRIDNFRGTTEEYIRYLECEVSTVVNSSPDNNRSRSDGSWSWTRS